MKQANNLSLLQIQFIAIRGSGASSDIAVDDIQLIPGYCTGNI